MFRPNWLPSSGLQFVDVTAAPLSRCNTLHFKSVKHFELFSNYLKISRRDYFVVCTCCGSDVYSCWIHISCMTLAHRRRRTGRWEGRVLMQYNISGNSPHNDKNQGLLSYFWLTGVSWEPLCSKELQTWHMSTSIRAFTKSSSNLHLLL
jgi:hypothetical protein